MRKPALTLAALLTATTLAACGGVDKNEYVNQVTTVQKATQTDASELGTKMQSAKTPAQVAQNLTDLGKAVEVNAVKLEKIEAPDDVAAQHAKYVKLMKDYGNDLQELAVKVKAATPTTVPKILTDAQGLTSNLSSEETKIVSDINNELQN